MILDPRFKRFAAGVERTGANSAAMIVRVDERRQGEQFRVIGRFGIAYAMHIAAVDLNLPPSGDRLVSSFDQVSAVD